MNDYTWPQDLEHQSQHCHHFGKVELYYHVVEIELHPSLEDRGEHLITLWKHSKTLNLTLEIKYNGAESSTFSLEDEMLFQTWWMNEIKPQHTWRWSSNQWSNHQTWTWGNRHKSFIKLADGTNKATLELGQGNTTL